MKEKIFNHLKVKKKYLKFINNQEVPGETFKNKISQLNRYYLPITKMIYDDFKKNNNPRIIGLSGGQGSGKSTVSKILKIILKEKYNLEVVAFSIDDFYKTFDDRKKMSKTVSNLFLTRGVPGTHDTTFLLKILINLKKKLFKKVLVPKFDKSRDDRCKKKEWIKVKKKPNIIIFEGWCVGALPERKSSLSRPLNDLERFKDQNQRWRNKINYELQTSYKKIFKLIDFLIFLKVPSFKYVYKWRALQEKKLKKNSKGKKIMSKKQVKEFVMFYERLTRNMLKSLDAKSDLTLNLNTNHCFKSIKIN